MTLKMIVNSVDPEEIRIALLDNGKLTDFDIETRGSATNTGNIYKGRVVDVMPSLNAAFVNYGADKQGFLTANDVNPRISGIDESKLEKAPSIEELLKPGQDILVQVTKDEVGKKGAVLTTYLALAGRYVVLMPSTNRQGVSRKIQDEESRRKMREAADKLRVPDGMGVIIRTAGRDRDKVALARDLKILLGSGIRFRRMLKSEKHPTCSSKSRTSSFEPFAIIYPLILMRWFSILMTRLTVPQTTCGWLCRANEVFYLVTLRIDRSFIIGELKTSSIPSSDRRYLWSQVVHWLSSRPKLLSRSM